MRVYVLEHVKHVYDKDKGYPVDVRQMCAVFTSFEEASFAGAKYAEVRNLLGSDPVYVWWKMEPEPDRRWWLSNEFGLNKQNVGNSLRITEYGGQHEADRLDPVGQGSQAA